MIFADAKRLKKISVNQRLSAESAFPPFCVKSKDNVTGGRSFPQKIMSPGRWLLSSSRQVLQECDRVGVARADAARRATLESDLSADAGGCTTGQAHGGLPLFVPAQLVAQKAINSSGVLQRRWFNLVRRVPPASPVSAARRGMGASPGGHRAGGVSTIRQARACGARLRSGRASRQAYA